MELGERMVAAQQEFSKAREAMVKPTSEDIEKLEKMNVDLVAIESDYARLKRLEIADDERKAASDAAREAAEKPSNFLPFPVKANGNGQALAPTTGYTTSISQKAGDAVTVFDRFIDSDAYKSIRKQGHHQGITYSVEVPGTIKAAGDPITSAQFGPRTTDPSVPSHYSAMPNVYDLFRIVPVSGTSSVRYYQATMPLSNNAAFIAEGASKPEVQPRWAPVDAPIETVAEWTAVTLQALDDVPQLRAVLYDDLRRLLLLKIDEKLLAGSGTPPEIRGILATSGIQTQAFTTDALTTLANAIGKVVNTGAGYPTGIVMNPADWQTIRTMTVSGIWPFGSPADPGVMRIWGIPVVASVNQAAGFAIVADFNYGTIFERWGVTFIVGLKNDDLIKNLQTIVCEARLALAIRRPSAFVNADIVTP
jgi:HK97 family phage major capsid protein